MKLPITFTSLISSALIKQKHGILSIKDDVGVNPSPLNFSYLMFVGNHIPDTVLPKI